MMKQLTTVVFIFLVSTMLLGLVATSYGESGSIPVTREENPQADHTAMSVEGLMYILGDMTIEGVRGMAHLKDVRETMAKMDMATTHHLMVAFAEKKTGAQIVEGKVALKIKRPGGDVSQPIKLVGMQGHFGADIQLNQAGKYEFMISTQLSDGVKRTFVFDYELR